MGGAPGFELMSERLPIAGHPLCCRTIQSRNQVRMQQIARQVAQAAGGGLPDARSFSNTGSAMSKSGLLGAAASRRNSTALSAGALRRLRATTAEAARLTSRSMVSLRRD